MTDQTVVAALRERLARPPIVERASLRLLPPAGSDALVFEQQTLAGDWQPLIWDGDRIAVDRWREVVAVGDRLWAATPAGLVDFARQPAGAAVLDPDRMLVVREPVGEAGLCTISDLARAEEQVLLRCDSTSEQVYSGALDGTRDTEIFHRLAGSDPFAEQIFVSRERGGVWEWALDGRRDGDPGQVQATRVRGGVPEEIQLVGGRFDFDEIDSLALFRDDQIEIASRSGWFHAPRGRFAADAWDRPSTTNPAPASVRAVAVARAGDERFLCLIATAGTTRMAVDGSSQAGRCAEYLGDDDLWRYERERDSARVVAPGKGGEGERIMRDGRFNDDTVTGVPVALREGDALTYLVPTAAGILHMEAGLRKQAISADFAGLPVGSAPTALYLWAADTPAYLAGGALYSLADDQRLLDLPLDLPDGAIIRSIEDGPRDLLLVKWSADGKRGWSLFARTVGLPATRNRLLLDLSLLGRYQQRRVEWGASVDLAELAVADDRVELFWPNPAQAYAFPYPAGLDLVAAIGYGERLLLFGRHELYEVNLEPALLQAHQAP